MFQEALQRVVDGTEGGMAGVIMDLEGILVDTYSRPDSPFDVEAVGVEVSVLLKSMRRATEMLEAGTPSEVALKSSRLLTLVRMINDEFFVALTLSPEGNIGKGRYLLRVTAPALLGALA